MVRIAQIAAAAALAAMAGAPLRAQEQPGPRPADYIAARLAAMNAAEGLLGGLESDAGSGTVDETEAFVSLEAIAAALDAFALLFPADTNLIGTINAVQVALPHLSEGASIIATGSLAAMMDIAKVDQPGKDLGGVAYVCLLN